MRSSALWTVKHCACMVKDVFSLVAAGSCVAAGSHVAAELCVVAG